MEHIIMYSIWGVFLFWGIYINYMTMRDDFRNEKERKAKLKKEQDHDHH